MEIGSPFDACTAKFDTTRPSFRFVRGVVRMRYAQRCSRVDAAANSRRTKFRELGLIGLTLPQHVDVAVHACLCRCTTQDRLIVPWHLERACRSRACSSYSISQFTSSALRVKNTRRGPKAFIPGYDIFLKISRLRALPHDANHRPKAACVPTAGVGKQISSEGVGK